MTTSLAEALLPGDTFARDGVRVVVLREREQGTDRFGRTEYRYWCRREDTGAEGWMPFGPGGFVADVVRSVAGQAGEG